MGKTYSFQELLDELNIPQPLRRRIRQLWYKIQRRLREWFIVNPRQWYQRARYGYSIYDRFSISDYLSWWLPKAIYEMRTVNNGQPFGYPAGIGSLGSVMRSVGEEVDEGAAKWGATLQGIEEGFKAANRIMNQDFRDDDELTQLEMTMNVGLQLFAKHFLDLWD